MTLEDRLVAVMPITGPGITSREAALAAGLSIASGQKVMQRLAVKGRVRRLLPSTHPAQYLRNADPAPEAYVPVTTVQRAMREVPTCVWDLGGRGAAP